MTLLSRKNSAGFSIAFANNLKLGSHMMKPTNLQHESLAAPLWREAHCSDMRRGPQCDVLMCRYSFPSSTSGNFGK